MTLIGMRPGLASPIVNKMDQPFDSQTCQFFVSHNTRGLSASKEEEVVALMKRRVRGWMLPGQKGAHALHLDTTTLATSGKPVLTSTEAPSSWVSQKIGLSR